MPFSNSFIDGNELKYTENNEPPKRKIEEEKTEEEIEEINSSEVHQEETDSETPSIEREQ